jgi:hypothetical protein
VLTFAAAGLFVLASLSIVCFAAYKIKARKFEVAAAVWKFVSLRITIQSADDDTKPGTTKPELKS